MKMQLLLLAVVLLLGCTSTGTQAAQGTPSQSEGGGSEVSDSVWIPLSDISGTAAFYEYDYDGAKIKYFAVKGSDGVVRTAFDACEVCYRAKKGYRQEGDSVVCNNCGLKFKIDDLGTRNKGSGCWPAYLPHEVKDGKVYILKDDLEAGSYMFS